MGKTTSEKSYQYEKAILNIIWKYTVVSRTTIHKITGIRPSTITEVTKGLLADGVICEVSQMADSTSGGVSKKNLMINKDYCRIIGVDIQAQQVIAVLTDFCGNILENDFIPLGADFLQEQIIKAVYSAIDHMLLKSDGKHILGIGISTIGILNRKTNTVMVTFSRANWDHVALYDLIARYYPDYPVYTEDQVVCKLYADKWFTDEPFYTNTVYVDIGNVIGASMFFGGTVLRNNVGIIGEIGHFTISDSNELCTCGNIGCLTTVASSDVIVHKVRRALENGTISVLNDMTQGDLSRLNIELILQAAEQNDRVSVNYLMNVALHIGKAISYIVNLLGPEMLILGGPMISNSEFFTDAIISEVKKNSLYLMADDLKYRNISFPVYGGALGATCLPLENYYENSNPANGFFYQHFLETKNEPDSGSFGGEEL